MARTTTTGRVVKNDYASFFLACWIVIVPVLLGFVCLFGFIPRNRHGRGGQEIDARQLAPVLGAVALVNTGLFGWLIARRVGTIKRVIATGTDVTGTVTFVMFQKDRGRVEYEYALNGQAYRSGNAVMKTDLTARLQPGDEVALIVDPQKPTRAFLATLYSDLA